LPQVNRKAAVLAECLLVSVASMAVMALIYPDMFLTAQVRFTAGHDIMVPHQSAWVHAGYFLRDGVQLWSRHDQMNQAFIHLGTGFLGLTGIVEGALFAQLAGLFDRPGEAFQYFHPWVFFSLAALFRTAGGLALLCLYPIPRWARVLALIVMNTVLAGPTYNGLMVGFLYSLAPLVLYFFIVFFRCVSLRSFLWVVLALGLAFAQAPLMAIGYFYMPIHLFVFCAAVAFGWWAIVARRSGVPGPVLEKPGGRRRDWLVLGLGFAALAVILAMNVNYLRILSETFYIYGSGLTGTSGRFDNMLSPMAFLTSGGTGANMREMASFVLDFTENRWWYSWHFFGAAVLGLSLIGLTHGRHRERWIFGMAFILVVLAQFPRSLTSFGLPAHLILGFTDPTAFIIGGFHMSMMVSFYLLVVPVGLGIAALRQRVQLPAPEGRVPMADSVCTALLLAGAIYALVALPLLSGVVEAGIFLVLALCLNAPRIAFLRPAPRMRLLALAPLLVVLVDLGGYSMYLYDVPYTGDRIQQRDFEGIQSVDGPVINPVVIDYQNPATLGFPRHLRIADFPAAVNTDPGFPSSQAYYWSLQTYVGAHYNTVFQGRVFYPPRTYEMRHVQYAEATNYTERENEDTRSPEGQAIWPLLAGDNRAAYFVPVGVDGAQVTLRSFLAADAARWAVVLTAPDGTAVDGALAALPVEAPELAELPNEARTYRLTLADASQRPRDGFVEYSLSLPDGFPAYIATNLFSDDRNAIRLTIDGRELAPAQGYLIRPDTFDVRNVATDRLVVALEADQPADTALELRVTIDGLVKDVAPNTNDTTGLHIVAPADGWLVWRMPYEEGWRATVSGETVPVSLANHTGMAVPVSQGPNYVEFSYKTGPDDCCTRQLVQAHLFASPLLALLVLGMALFGTAAGYGRPRFPEAEDAADGQAS
jgi:hypothetical protein